MREPDLYDSATALAGENTVKFTRGNNIEFFSHVKNAPTKTEIDSKLIELQTEYDSQEYARKRKEEYDALNQFELISDDDVNGTTTHKDAIAAIKAKWPKDNSGPV